MVLFSAGIVSGRYYLRQVMLLVVLINNTVIYIITNLVSLHMAVKLVYILILIAVSLSAAGDSTAATSPLTDSQQKTLDEVTASFPVFSCDSMPLARAVKNAPACLMAKHLFPFARWIASKGKTIDECKKELSDRQLSFSDPQRFSIDLTGVPIGGDAAAPITIVVYLSGLCPLCKYISCELYREVTSGMLKGKARLAVKPCRAARADEAIVAAAHFKKPWEFLIALHTIKIRPDEPVLLKLADSLGIDSVRFKQYLNTRELQSVIERNSAEAVRNGVSYTPTVFVNGRRYHSYTDPRWVVDAALYENEVLKRSPR
jgi:hypothetical protein